MSNTLIAPEHELFPNRYRWTVAECYEMAAEGRLIGRYEILDGEVIRKMGQNPPHYFCISQLAHWANAVFGDTFVRVQGPIALPEPDGVYSEPEPGVAITRESSIAYASRQPGPDDLRLLVEVSDTTLRTDLIVKARLYARAGIAEYWVLDLNARQMRVHRAPVGNEYSVVTVHAETETVTLGIRPEAPIAIADLLPPAA